MIPSSACEIHQRLGLNIDCATFDINQGCAGYIYGLQVASSIVDSKNSKNTLLITLQFYCFRVYIVFWKANKVKRLKIYEIISS